MTSWALTIAAVLCLVLALGHSYLGERYILIRLFRRENLPHLFGSDVFTKRTLRFAWHITSVAWLGFGALLWAYAVGDSARHSVLLIIAVTFAAHAIVTLVGSRGRHLAWIVFAAVSVLAVSARGSEPVAQPVSPMADAEVLLLAREHPDASAFLARYPRASVAIDRSGRLAVDFRAAAPKSERNRRTPVRLRIFIDPDSRRPSESALACGGRFLEGDVHRHLERFWATGECPSE